VTEFYYGLSLDREDNGGINRHTLRSGSDVLGTAIEQLDGTTSVTIVEHGKVYRPPGIFLAVDDALMAIKTYHDVRNLAGHAN